MVTVIARHKIRRAKGVPDAEPREPLEVDDKKKQPGTGKTEFEELMDAKAIVSVEEAPKALGMSKDELERKVERFRKAGPADASGVTPPSQNRAQLEARAKELGISVRSNMHDDTIADKIREAEAQDDDGEDDEELV